MKNYFLLLVCFLMTACTYTITMVHTEGSAEDVVDETSTNTPTVSPTISNPGI